MSAWAEWDHIVKIDPDKELPPGTSYRDVAATGTDAIEVGGTTGMTEEKMAEVVEACGEYDIPVYVEPSNPAAVVHSDAHEGYLVPIVLNAGDPTWITGAHKEWVRIDDEIDWSRTWTEAYVVMNPDASVAAYTDADCDLEPDDVAAYATVAEQLLGQEIVYVEYSGTLGDPEVVAAAAEALEETTLFYGGGIHDYDSAHTMATHGRRREPPSRRGGGRAERDRRGRERGESRAGRPALEGEAAEQSPHRSSPVSSVQPEYDGRPIDRFGERSSSEQLVDSVSSAFRQDDIGHLSFGRETRPVSLRDEA
jgi:phosphoglycerol geranylgeranyltransferase